MSQTVAKKPSLIKWIFIIFTAFFFLVAVFLGVLVWKFTPLFDANARDARVRLLGGWIDLDGKEGTLKVGTRLVKSQEGSIPFEGSRALGSTSSGVLELFFTNGRFDLSTSTSNEVTWSCKLITQPSGTFFREKAGKTILDFRDLPLGACKMAIPKKVKVFSKGISGRFDLNQIQFDLKLELANGFVLLQTMAPEGHVFQIEVMNGHVDRFISSENPSASTIEIKLLNGSIVGSDP